MSAVVATNAASAQPSPVSGQASGQTQPPIQVQNKAENQNAGSQATGLAGASAPSDTTASTASVVAALKKLGLSPTEIEAALAKLKHNQATTTKAAQTDATTQATTADVSAQAAALANGTVVPIAGQPQLALGFAVDPVSIATAAGQAITALTGQTGATASSVSPATASAATTAATTDVTAAAALLAQQDVVSVSGKVAGSGTTAQAAVAAAAAVSVRTIANQSGSPALTNPAQAAGDVATAAIQQATGNMPMSRMSEIRAKLQAAQLGASKTTGSTTSTSSTTEAATASPATIETAVAAEAATAGAGITEISQKLTAAVTAAQTGVSGSADKPAADTSGDALQASADPSTMTVDPSLAGITQDQTTQTQTQQSAIAAQTAVPLAALSSTLVAHAKAGDSEFNIRLDPAGLGQIDVKMKVSSDGEVRAHLIVDQPATLDLMMRDKQQLQQSLDQAGFKTDPSSLQFSLKDQGQNQNQQQSGRDQSSQSNSAATADTAITPLQSAVYSRQSYIRADGVDLSV